MDGHAHAEFRRGRTGRHVYAETHCQWSNTETRGAGGTGQSRDHAEVASDQRPGREAIDSDLPVQWSGADFAAGSIDVPFGQAFPGGPDPDADEPSDAAACSANPWRQQSCDASAGVDHSGSGDAGPGHAIAGHAGTRHESARHTGGSSGHFPQWATHLQTSPPRCAYESAGPGEGRRHRVLVAARQAGREGNEFGAVTLG